METLKPEDFKRCVGVKPDTFEEIVREVKRQEKLNRVYPLRHRPPKYDVEDQVLMTLLYWREYRTLFHISKDYDLSEATVCRTIKKVENMLSKSKKFTLPGKKTMQKNSFQYEVWVVDSTETPVERPKKNSRTITPARKRNTR